MKEPRLAGNKQAAAHRLKQILDDLVMVDEATREEWLHEFSVLFNRSQNARIIRELNLGPGQDFGP